MRSTSNRGFVLAATLWILAILMIAVGYFAERVARSLEQARRKQDTAEGLVAFANTRAEILFRFSTSYLNPHGLGQQPIALDDRPYRGTGEDVVHLQDNRGLVNVNFVQGALMSGLLTQVGIPLARRDAMLDSLRDYTDPDNLRRLNGAERGEYEALGLPPPPNEWLDSPHQVQAIIGWRDPGGALDDRLAQYLTTARTAGFNPNTAPLEVLRAIPGLTRETALALVQRRFETPLTNLGEVPGYIPNLMEADQFIFFPGESLRITQHSRSLPWGQQWSVTLTPQSLQGPWRIDYFGRTVVSYALENQVEIPKLPAWMAPAPAQESAP